MKATARLLMRLGIFLLALVAYLGFTLLMMMAWHHFFGTVGGISP
jgi:membrane-anchored glycerophosphoryl diester phosphodiesterase (GDPDase)